MFSISNKYILVVLFLGLLMMMGCSQADAESKSIEYYNKGVEYYSTGQAELAEQQYKLAIKENPELAEAYLNLGLLYLETGWLEGGEEQTLKAIELLEKQQKTIIEGSTVEETLSISYNNMGIIEIEKAIEQELKFDYEKAFKHWEKAMSFFEKAISLYPNNSHAQANIRQFKDAY